MIEENDHSEMRNYFETYLYGKMEQYPSQKKAKLEEAPFLQKCHLDLFDSVANSDIDINKIKAKVFFK